MDKFSRGQSNFEIVLASQSCVFGKAGLGFNPNSKSKSFTSFFENKKPIVKSIKPVETCFYYMNKGHPLRFYREKRFYVPKGLLKWFPKVLTNIVGHKFIKEPNLAP